MASSPISLAFAFVAIAVFALDCILGSVVAAAARFMLHRNIPEYVERRGTCQRPGAPQRESVNAEGHSERGVNHLVRPLTEARRQTCILVLCRCRAERETPGRDRWGRPERFKTSGLWHKIRMVWSTCRRKTTHGVLKGLNGSAGLRKVRFVSGVLTAGGHRVTRWVAVLGLVVGLVVAGGAGTPASAASKDASLIMDAQTGKILFSRSADEARFPASLTKMMTLYLLFERLQEGKLALSTKLNVSSFAAGQEPSKLGLKPGTTITVEEAIGALIIRSANDVAVVVAEAIGGSEAKFARLMTQKARALSMRNTYFYNASGLPHPLQRSTARDMATLGRALMKNFPQYYDRFAARTYTFRGKTYETHNDLLVDFVGANGIKTGYTRASGFNLVSSAERDGRRIIGVVMGGRTARERDNEMRAILGSMFDKIEANPTMVAAYEDPRGRYTQVASAVTAPPKPVRNPNVRAPGDPGVVAMAPIPDEPQAPREVVSLASADPLAELIAETVAEPRRAEPRGADQLAAVVPQPRTTRVALRTNIDAGAMPSYVAEAPGRLIWGGDVSEVRTASLASALLGEIGEGDTPTSTRRTASSDPRTWGIQVGAYRDRDVAQMQVEVIADAAEAILGDTEAVVTPFSTKDGPIYRARFGPFSPAEARDACTKLEARGLACLAVADSDWSLAAGQ
ncbi:MAG: hypothetical protein GC199_07900 [Alphaproteobacteria bacterium]|nr:hypothetical protein [Alphaproteobacteria bacterium]